MPTGSANPQFGRDAFSYSLGYHDGDYEPIGQVSPVAGNFNEGTHYTNIHTGTTS
ncbi:hypothetical protein [Candidatus Pollutiaquabacter sp.]|uniref:hypothetical protein n=1 Tax=Candidatus Pollutiaquabacter sp. TaxID=3416354 RepID=UPI003CA4F5D0|nr:hypothetical protein [Bacteroidota bacterium]